jgi:cation-transporting P-type ATPase E
MPRRPLHDSIDPGFRREASVSSPDHRPITGRLLKILSSNLMSAQLLLGLTAEEVEERHRRGQSNRPFRPDRLQYAQIVSRNLFTLFNAIVVPAAIVLLILNDSRGAIAVSGMATVNTAIGLFQEIVTKRRLEPLVILAEPKVRALRNGRVEEIPASEVVLGDHHLLAIGEMVVADGPVLEARFLEYGRGAPHR